MFDVAFLKPYLTSLHVASADSMSYFCGEDDARLNHDDSNDLKGEMDDENGEKNDENGDCDLRGDHFHQLRSNPTLRSSLFEQNTLSNNN